MNGASPGVRARIRVLARSVGRIVEEAHLGEPLATAWSDYFLGELTDLVETAYEVGRLDGASASGIDSRPHQPR